MARNSDRRRPGRSRRRSQVTTAIVIISLIITVAFVYAVLSLNSGPKLALDWRIKVTLHDSRFSSPTFGQNITIPANIGVEGGIWVNRTLERYGLPGFSPISTRDNTGTIYFQTVVAARENGQPLLLTFGDFFNVWGVPFNETCVWFYCAKPGEPVVYDLNDNGVYEAGENLTRATPSVGAPLSSETRLKVADSNSNGTFDPGETVAFDANSNGVYDEAELVITGQVPSEGTQLVRDPKVRFQDENYSIVWDPKQPPPVMSDGQTDARCLKRSANLSNGKDWVIIIGSTLAAGIGGCPPGSF